MSEVETRKAEARARANEHAEKGIWDPPSYEFNPEGYHEYVGTRRAKGK